jgi:hypothetical protein
MQTLQPYIESGLVQYHWVNKTALPAKGQPGKQPPQLAVRALLLTEREQFCNNVRLRCPVYELHVSYSCRSGMAAAPGFCPAAVSTEHLSWLHSPVAHTITWPLSSHAQIYDICIHEFRHRHAWMGFFDADEFLVLRNRSTQLPSFLKVSAMLAYQRS